MAVPHTGLRPAWYRQVIPEPPRTPRLAGRSALLLRGTRCTRRRHVFRDIESLEVEVAMERDAVAGISRGWGPCHRRGATLLHISNFILIL